MNVISCEGHETCNGQNQVFLHLITDIEEPSGLLPFELTASTEAVVTHCEDRPIKEWTE